MADKVKAIQPCPTPDGYPLTRQDMCATPDIDHLATSMQNLRAESITEGQEAKQIPDSEDDMSNLETIDLEEEYYQIKSVAEETLRYKQGLGKMIESSKTLMENLDQASNFIVRYEDSLPKGKHTDPALVEKVFLDLNSEKNMVIRSPSEDSGDIVSYSDVVDELRYIAENNDAMAFDLDMVLHQGGGDMVDFIRKYADIYSHVDPSLLKKAAEEIWEEIDWKNSQEEKRKQLKAQQRKEFVGLYRQYHELIQLGASSSLAMEKLKQIQDETNGNSGRTTSQSQEEAEGFTESTYTSTASKKRDSGVDIKKPPNEDLDSSDIGMGDDAELSARHRDDQVRGIRSRSASPDMKQDKVSRGTPARSPEKRRTASTGSMDRDRSPTKKAKGTSTRGVARVIKKHKHRTSPVVTPVKTPPEFVARNNTPDTRETTNRTEDINKSFSRTPTKKPPRRQAKHRKTRTGIA